MVAVSSSILVSTECFTSIIDFSKSVRVCVNACSKSVRVWKIKCSRSFRVFVITCSSSERVAIALNSMSCLVAMRSSSRSRLVANSVQVIGGSCSIRMSASSVPMTSQRRACSRLLFCSVKAKVAPLVGICKRCVPPAHALGSGFQNAPDYLTQGCYPRVS